MTNAEFSKQFQSLKEGETLSSMMRNGYITHVQGFQCQVTLTTCNYGKTREMKQRLQQAAEDLGLNLIISQRMGLAHSDVIPALEQRTGDSYGTAADSTDGPLQLDSFLQMPQPMPGATPKSKGKGKGKITKKGASPPCCKGKKQGQVTNT